MPPSPNRYFKIPQSFFKGFGGQHWIENGVPANQMRDFSPIGSTTFTIAIKEERGSLDRFNDKFRALARLRASQLYELFHSKPEFHAWRDKFIGTEGEER